MTKVTGPLLSFGASGTIAKTQVYSRWRGVAYARRWSKPGNPNTDPQKFTRRVFRWLNSVWQFAAPELLEPWNMAATGRPLTGRNLFLSRNVAVLRGTTLVPVVDTHGFIASPGARGGFPVPNFAAANGTASIDCTVDEPSLPDGWMLTGVIYTAISDGDVKLGVLPYVSYTVEAIAAGMGSDWPATIPAVPSGNYSAFAFGRYTRPDGLEAFGASSFDAVVVT